MALRAAGYAGSRWLHRGREDAVGAASCGAKALGPQLHRAGMAGGAPPGSSQTPLFGPWLPHPNTSPDDLAAFLNRRQGPCPTEGRWLRADPAQPLQLVAIPGKRSLSGPAGRLIAAQEPFEFSTDLSAVGPSMGHEGEETAAGRGAGDRWGHKDGEGWGRRSH